VRFADGRRLDILRDVNLEVAAGESVAIMGRSGSGKTTLLTILGLLRRADGGRYELAGTDVTDLDSRSAAKTRGASIGFIFQGYQLFDHLSALDNVAAPLYCGSTDAFMSRRHTANELLRAVGLADRAEVMPSRLSGGEQQRIAVARSLVRRPSLILADEPTGSLDVDTGTAVLNLLFEIVRTLSHTLVLITHDPAVAALADRSLTLQGGELRQS
jgi:putative ABC transport system ATP-binding protein